MCYTDSDADTMSLNPPPSYEYVIASAPVAQSNVIFSKPPANPSGEETIQVSQQPVQYVFLQPAQQFTSAEAPNDCLIYAIFTFACCCWPLGLVALIRSIQCKSAISQGNMAEANRLSQQSRSFSHASLVCGIILIITYITFRMLV